MELDMPADLAGRTWRNVLTGQPQEVTPDVAPLLTPLSVAVLVTIGNA
jgi:hypothetical protein